MDDPQPALRDGGPPRPDPARGIAVTLPVAGGAAQDLDAHVAHLAAGARELYGLELGDGVRSALATLGTAAARCRVELRAQDGEARVNVRTWPPEEEVPGDVELVPFVLEGGLGRWEWLDRRLAGDLARRAGEATALLVDADGEVLEPLGGHLYVVEAGRLVGTPEDARRRPDAGRGRLPVAAVGPLTLERVAAADRVVVTSALHAPRVGRLRAR